MKVHFDELWEPWDLGDDAPEWERNDWPIPNELAERFRKAKAEMEAVWREIHELNPELDDR